MNYEFWKKAGIATGALGTIAIAGTVLASDTATNINNDAENGFQMKRVMMQRMHKAHHFMQNEDVKAAIESRDYNAFVAAVTPENGQAPKILETITANNFSKFCDMHNAIKNQDFETAKSIAEELGLPGPGMRGNGQGQGNGQPVHTEEEREAIHAAVLDGDYQAWFALTATDGELPERFKVINADNFAKFSEMHQLMDGAKTIREELGLELTGKGMGRGMHRGMGNR
ncbi:MAG: hypothetical protein ACOYUZ_03720 [Patescibacteria group bacterium]